MTREEELRNQYNYEKSLLEQYGYQSVTTFEEWLEIKGIQVEHDMVKSGNEQLGNSTQRRESNKVMRL